MDINMGKIVRTGLVSSVNSSKMTVRVTFPDEDGLVSGDLRIVNRGSKGSRDYWLPEVNEQVLCLFCPNGRNAGYCLGTFFSEAEPPPSDAAQGKRILECGGDLEIRCGGAVNITGAAGDITINGISLSSHTHPESIGTVTGPPR